MGFIEVNGLQLELPQQPPKTKMVNYGKKKVDQYWERQELPEFMEDYDHYNPTDEQVEFIEKELDKIFNGIWILIYGEPYWITGENYLFLNYWKLDTGFYPDFRFTDVRFFWWWEICKRHPKCLGTIFGKFRRQGASSRGALLSVKTAITNTNGTIGTMSKTGTDSKEIFTDMIVNGFKNFPEFLKPETSGTDKAVKELLFIKQTKRLTKDNKIVGKVEGLNTKINWMPTATNSYDSKRLLYLFLDEGSKFPKDVPFNKYWNIVKRTLIEGGKRWGMCYAPSTINESGNGLEEFEIVYKNSDHNAKGFDGTTPSGLFKFFQAACDGLRGYIDRYGHSVIENPTPEQYEFLKNDPDCPNPEIGAREYILRERDKLKNDPDALSEYIRQFPLNEKELFYRPSKGSLFNPVIVNEQLDYIEEAKIPIRKGRFHKDEKTGNIKFLDDPQGMWQLLWDFKDQSEANQSRIIYGKKSPLNKHLFSIGVDTYASSEGASFGDGSMGVAFIRRHFNPVDPNNSDMYIGMLQWRPKVKALFFEQIFYAAQYFGCLAGFEATISDFFDYATEYKYDNYLLYTPEPLRSDRAKLVKAGIPATGAKSREYHTNMLLNDFLENHKKIYFKELLNDMLRFDPEDRTISDWCMAAGYSIITQENSIVRNIVTEEVKSAPLLKTYRII